MRDALAKKDAPLSAAEALPDGAIGQVSRRLAEAFDRLENALKNKSDTHQHALAALKETHAKELAGAQQSGGDLEAKYAQEIEALKRSGNEKEKALRALVAESAKEVEKSIRSIDAVLGA